MRDESINGQVSLHTMVNRIVASSLSHATRKNSFIINDVPVGMYVHANENMLATVFGSLLNAVITNTHNTCIRVSAKFYGKIVLLNLRETYQLNSSSFANSLRQIQQLAEKIGGTVSVSHNQGEATTIVFSFLNNLSAAA